MTVEIIECPSQTETTPNSQLPILVYRNALPDNCTEGSISEEERSTNAKQFFKERSWTTKGTWGSIDKPHYHSNTHECYGVIAGASALILGLPVNIAIPPGDYILENPTVQYVEVSLKLGDVIVLPAGVSHASKYFDADYRYVGSYPIRAPQWKSIYSINTKSKKYNPALDLAECKMVDMPDEDPILGGEGTLLKEWNRRTVIC